MRRQLIVLNQPISQPARSPPRPVRRIESQTRERVERVTDYTDDDIFKNIIDAAALYPVRRKKGDPPQIRKKSNHIKNILNRYNLNTAQLTDMVAASNRNNVKRNFSRLYNTKNNLQNIASRTITRSEGARLILYSGTLDLGKAMQIKPLFTAMCGRLDVRPQIVEVSVRSKFKTMASYTREYGLKEDANVKYDILTIKLLVDDKGHAVNIFSTGKVTFTGGYPDDAKTIIKTPKEVLGLVFKNDGRPYDKALEIKSVTAQMETNLTGKISAIKNAVEGANSKNSTYFVKIVRGGKDIRIYDTGVIQVSRIKTQSEFNHLDELIDEEVIQPLKSAGVVDPLYRFTKIYKTKPQKRAQGQIAPDVTYRSTTCPIDKRPIPYTFSGVPPTGKNGRQMYVGVNPQGQPCSYTVPKKLSYIRPKVIARFGQLGIQIPAVTKQLLGINIDNSNLPKEVSGKMNTDIIFRNSTYKRGDEEIKSFKIGTRLCERYSMTRLVDIARRMGIAFDVKGKSKSMSKKDLCDNIYKWAKKHGQVKNNRAYNNQGQLRLGNTGRVATSYTKTQLINKARSLGVHISSNSISKNQMIQEIKRHLRRS
jgi:hypothetical protein